MKIISESGKTALRWTTEIPGAEEIHDLCGALEWNGFLRLEPERLRLAMQGSWRVVSVYAEEELAGTGRLVSDGVVSAYLCGVGVREHWRGRGIGSEIVRRLTKEARLSGLHIQLFASCLAWRSIGAITEVSASKVLRWAWKWTDERKKACRGFRAPAGFFGASKLADFISRVPLLVHSRKSRTSL